MSTDKLKSGPLKPLLTDDEVALFNKYLDNATYYFETGSGGSTFIASTKPNIKRMVVVESNANWLKLLRTFEPVYNAACKDKRLSMYHVDIRGHPDKAGIPIDFAKEYMYPIYAGAITFLTGSPWEAKPDLVFVDGRFRVACAIHAFLVVDSSAIIIIHDYEREFYRVVETFLDKIEQSNRLAVFKPKRMTAELKNIAQSMLHGYNNVWV